MIEIKMPQARAYKRERKAPDGTTYTELLFLRDDEISLELIEEVDSKPCAYLNGVEDRSVYVTILGESFYARLIRPSYYFSIGHNSYGVEISNLLAEYFGINIFNNNYPPRKKELKIAYKTSSINHYCYNIQEMEPDTEIKSIPENGQCPLCDPDQEPDYDVSSCDDCPFFLKKTYYYRDEIYLRRHEKLFTGCLRPRLKWPE